MGCGGDFEGEGRGEMIPRSISVKFKGKLQSFNLDNWNEDDPSDHDADISFNSLNPDARLPNISMIRSCGRDRRIIIMAKYGHTELSIDELSLALAVAKKLKKVLDEVTTGTMKRRNE